MVTTYDLITCGHSSRTHSSICGGSLATARASRYGIDDGDDEAPVQRDVVQQPRSALSATSDTCLDDAMTGCSRGSSVYGLQRDIFQARQSQLSKLPPTSALWRISVILLDFHECTGRRGHDAKQPSTKALSSFDLYRVLRFTLCEGV
jgi:hypothetical protein